MLGSGLKDSKPRRRRGTASITTLAALFALAGVAQALSPAQAAAMDDLGMKACLEIGGQIVDTATGTICMRDGQEILVFSSTAPSTPYPACWNPLLCVPPQTGGNGIRTQNDSNRDRGFRGHSGHTRTRSKNAPASDDVMTEEEQCRLIAVRIDVHMSRAVATKQALRDALIHSGQLRAYLSERGRNAGGSYAWVEDELDAVKETIRTLERIVQAEYAAAATAWEESTIPVWGGSNKTCAHRLGIHLG
jgi:hypothetical protein